MAQDSPQSRAGSFISLRTLVDRVVEAWLDDFDLSEQSIRRMAEISERFLLFLSSAWHVRTAAVITPEHCDRFIKALVPSATRARSPATATMHLRRATLRLLFRTARDVGIYEGDPTLDLVLPPRSSLKVRALTDEEVALCRSFSLHTLGETRLPTAWALAEATARTSELPHIKVSDVDLKGGRVWLHGSSKAEHRWGALTSWGITQIKRRIDALPKTTFSLVYTGQGSQEAKQSASCIAISETLSRAGLGREPDVRPGSVVVWAGTRIFEQSGRIEEVARRLGIRSLDRAARFIDFDWKSGGEQD
jgi:integrase